MRSKGTGASKACRNTHQDGLCLVVYGSRGKAENLRADELLGTEAGSIQYIKYLKFFLLFRTIQEENCLDSNLAA